MIYKKSQAKYKSEYTLVWLMQNHREQPEHINKNLNDMGRNENCL
jgi:hypothetical protein